MQDQVSKNVDEYIEVSAPYKLIVQLVVVREPGIEREFRQYLIVPYDVSRQPAGYDWWDITDYDSSAYWSHQEAIDQGRAVLTALLSEIRESK